MRQKALRGWCCIKASHLLNEQMNLVFSSLTERLRSVLDRAQWQLLGAVLDDGHVSISEED